MTKKYVEKHIPAKSKKVENTVLLLTEGDSAKGMLEKVRDLEIHGAYPMKGCVKNTYGVKDKEILESDKTKEELGIKDYSTFIAPDSDSDKQFEAAQNYFSGYCIINCLNEIIPDCTPEGTSQLFLTTMTFGDVMKNIRPQDYKKFKTKVAEDMIETCEKALNISIKPYIEEIEIALPPTFCRYLNTPWGTPYGYMLEKWDSMLPRTIQYLADQPFDNFYFCGATQERGDGYGCAYYTGEKAGGLVVKAIKKEGK